MRDELRIESVANEGAIWTAQLSFRGKQRSLRFMVDPAGRIRAILMDRSPFAITIEGHEIGRIIDRVRHGESITFPHRVEPGPTAPRLPSIHDADWRDWTDVPVRVADVWLDRAERVGDARWLASLRLDGESEVFELEFLPGGGTREVRGPAARWFQSYLYDLQNLLQRMEEGERFALPFKLRPRWPTPPDPPSLP